MDGVSPDLGPNPNPKPNPVPNPVPRCEGEGGVSDTLGGRQYVYLPPRTVGQAPHPHPPHGVVILTF